MELEERKGNLSPNESVGNPYPKEMQSAPAVNNRNPTTVLNIDPQIYRRNEPPAQDDQDETGKHELEEFESLNFLILIVKYAQRSQLWIFVLTAFCCMRAASPFTVWMTWLVVFCRIIQVVALVI